MKKKHLKIKVPGDKSITHRAIIIASMARGKSVIINPLICEDTMATITAMRALGTDITLQNNIITVKGKGLHGFTAPKYTIDCGNSATTMRMLMGLLSGQKFNSSLTGDSSLMARPMLRVIDPLRQMGADIESGSNEYIIHGSMLHSIIYDMPVSSAQVKTALLLADYYADRKSRINDPGTSRNHTELMLETYGKAMKGRKIEIPGDISSAAYLIAKALITPDSDIKLLDVGINPTRTGYIDILKRMGADISCSRIRKCGREKAANIRVRYSHLKATEISGDIIPRVIDELPLIAVLACFADGTTTIRDAAELRVKESDRITATVNGINLLGGNACEKADGMDIIGSPDVKFHPAELETNGDHRIAMSFLILSDLIPVIKVKNKECVAVSYPTFFNDITSLFCS